MMHRKPMLPNCPKCGQMLESIDIGSPYIEAIYNYVDSRPVLLNTGVCRVTYRCEGVEWTDEMREGDARKLIDGIAWRLSDE